MMSRELGRHPLCEEIVVLREDLFRLRPRPQTSTSHRSIEDRQPFRLLVQRHLPHVLHQVGKGAHGRLPLRTGSLTVLGEDEVRVVAESAGFLAPYQEPANEEVQRILASRTGAILNHDELAGTAKK